MTSEVRAWSMPVALVLIGAAVALADLAGAQTLTCGQAVDIAGFSRMLGTFWAYLSGPAGKVIAISLLIFGAGSLIARNIGLGVAALIGAFAVAFSATIVNTLFSSVVIGAATNC